MLCSIWSYEHWSLKSQFCQFQRWSSYWLRTISFELQLVWCFMPIPCIGSFRRIILILNIIWIRFHSGNYFLLFQYFLIIRCLYLFFLLLLLFENSQLYFIISIIMQEIGRFFILNNFNTRLLCWKESICQLMDDTCVFTFH